MKSRHRLTGRVIFRGDPGYDKARKNWNPFVDTFPLVFVFAQETRDIQNALSWACENNVPIRFRSGRHALDKGLSEVKDGIVIDVSEMKRIRFNRKKGIAIVETGSNVGPTVKALAREGYMLPFGDSPTVGVGGITMGGGIGLLQRSIGLISDNLIGLKMVDADGNLIQADHHRNEDLLWASRGGGGGNFGVNTEYVYKLHKAPEKATVFEIDWPWDQLETVFKAWQNWAPDVDTRLGTILELFSKKNGTLRSTGLFLGHKDELEKLLKPLKNAGSPTKVFVKMFTYPDAVDYLIPTQKIPGRADANKKFSSNWAQDLLPDEAIKVMRQFLEESQSEDTNFFFLNAGGALNQPSPNETAFYWRNAKFYMEWNASWTDRSDQARNLALVEETRLRLKPFVEGSYVNVPDQFIRNFGPAYYGTNFDRLQRVKAKYDPRNVFQFPQSIPPKYY
ncbi:FAD-binding oxidoreductase [Alkalihalobacillus sp. CinArs1]|uniref:FAD-binding oxidoreductase n=1 Tax=Alkalihalobacillus sp. CinArs1 TaxID=2995314 RepID=UPI0022DE7086|nr:FAD-binding oxidoreductase [Alkalihalobacillus sp. CinArs1]